MCIVPFLVPELRDQFLVAFAQCRLFVSPHQSTAVQEELSERRTGEGLEGLGEGRRRKKQKNWLVGDPIYEN